MFAMTNKRQRELARAKYERQVVRRQERAKKQRTIRFIGLGVVIAVLIGGFAWSQAPRPTAQQSPAPTSSETRPNVVKGCTDAPAIRADNIKFSTPPTATTRGNALDLVTNCGSIGIALDKKAPMTVAIMTFLAQKKYFDQTECHRVTTAAFYVLQCGDPTATGSGGPGFKFADENLPKTTTNNIYKAGTVAMANSGPDSNGSQFFIVYKDSPLPAKYSVWGRVTQGLPIVKAIANAGTTTGTADGKPRQRVVIKRAIIR